MKHPKFIYQGIKYGMDPEGRRDHTDGYYYHYGIDINGKFWISRIEYKNGTLDRDATPNWRPNGVDGKVFEFTPDEIKGEFSSYGFIRERTHNSSSEYVTAHTGGSLRHAGIRVMDVMEMIHDYSKDATQAIEDAYVLGVLHEARRKSKIAKRKISKKK